MTNEERIELILVDLIPSDEEWDPDNSTEVSPGSKENDPKADKEPSGSRPKKRRRIMELDSDDSGDDQTFKPSKEVIDFICLAHEDYCHSRRDILFFSMTSKS